MTLLKAPIGLIVVALAATIAFHPVFQADATEAQRVVVEIRKFEFVPPVVDVAPGDIVVWKNMDIVPHTVTARDDGWDSATIAAGGEWETVVTGDMLGPYYCRFHPSMVATLGITTN